jgi:phosphopantothenoylcysteine decarboxylase/phosphopantothenate--cysteine ligase
MGYAIASAAWRRGFNVKLISGPVDLHATSGIELTRVETAAQMKDAVAAALPHADALVMAAAVADFRPRDPATTKIKKDRSAPSTIELEATEDILHSTKSLRAAGSVTVGFALETDDVIENGRRKLEQKDLDLVVINSAVEKGAGFETDTNRVTLMGRDGVSQDVPLQSKDEVAEIIVDCIVALLRGAQ